MCISKLFRNIVALEKDDGQVSFINMRIKALRKCPYQDEEAGAKHIVDTKRFQQPIPPLVGDLGDLIDLDDKQLENPTIAGLCGEDTTTQILEEGSEKEKEENNVDTLITM